MGIDLVIHYCGDSRAQRLAEYDLCVAKNLENPFVDAVHNLGIAAVPIPDRFRTHPKWRQVVIDRRMTFADAFRYASSTLAGRFVGICNLDIFLDATSDWNAAERLVRTTQIVLCQSRLEYAADGSIHRDPDFGRLAFATAQDAWFFVAPITPPSCEFEIGTMGCDNALADRLRKAGRVPVNMASRYRVLHVDNFRNKNGANTKAVHTHESIERGTVYSRFPEREGCYLVPDIDLVKSVDSLMTLLQVDDLRRYQVICDLVSERIRITN